MALLGEVEVLAATEKFTVPFPVPLPPEVTVTNAALLIAVHGQVEVVVTVMLPVPAAGVNDWFGGAIANEHPA